MNTTTTNTTTTNTTTTNTAAALAEWVENTMSLYLREVVFYGGAKGAREVKEFIAREMRAYPRMVGLRAAGQARKIEGLWERYVGPSGTLWEEADPTGEYRRLVELYEWSYPSGS